MNTGTLKAIDILLFLWLTAGVVWGIVLGIEEAYATSPDEALDLRKKNTVVLIPWIAALFVVGIPFIIYSKKHNFKTIGSKLMNYVID